MDRKSLVNADFVTSIFLGVLLGKKNRGVGRGGAGGHGPSIKSGQGAKKGHIFWPYLAYTLLTNFPGNIVPAQSKFTCTFKFLN